MFVDETQISMLFSDGLAHVNRRRDERTSANCILETDRFQGGSIMIWAGISQRKKHPQL